MLEFIKYLRRESLFALFAGTLLALVAGVVSWPLFLYALDAYDSFVPIRENEAFGLVVAMSSLSFVVFLVLFFRSFWKKPSAQEVAKQVEIANPELRDLLNCAVELEEKSRRDELTFMENRVVRLTESKAKEIAWGNGTAEILLLGGLGRGFCLGRRFFRVGHSNSPFQKTFAVFSDEPGLTVFTTKTVAAEQTQYPPSHEFSRGTDVSVFADVTRGHRGEKSAFIEFKEGGKIERLEMLSTPTLGRFEFVASSLQEPFEYRVVTPTLESGWERLSPFDPPAIIQAKWTVSPPAYLKTDPFEHFGFGYLRAPEGSILKLELEVEKSPLRVGAFIQGPESNVTLATQAPAVFVYSKELQSEWSGRLSLIDLDAPERGSVEYDEFVFAPIPDEPPLVEITEPAKDLQLPADASLLVEVFASDDHGVADVRINVSHAGEKEEETLFVEPIEKEKKLSYILDLNDRALAVGA